MIWNHRILIAICAEALVRTARHEGQEAKCPSEPYKQSYRVWLLIDACAWKSYSIDFQSGWLIIRWLMRVCSHGTHGRRIKGKNPCFCQHPRHHDDLLFTFSLIMYCTTYKQSMLVVSTFISPIPIRLSPYKPLRFSARTRFLIGAWNNVSGNVSASRLAIPCWSDPFTESHLPHPPRGPASPVRSSRLFLPNWANTDFGLLVSCHSRGICLRICK